MLSLPQYYTETRTHLSLQRTGRSRVPFGLSVARWRCQCWADCATNISERKFPTGTGGRGGYLKKSLGSQHHRPFSLDWSFEELTRCLAPQSHRAAAQTDLL